jgi:hypothetical protein
MYIHTFTNAHPLFCISCVFTRVFMCVHSRVIWPQVVFKLNMLTKSAVVATLVCGGIVLLNSRVLIFILLFWWLFKSIEVQLAGG